MCGQWWAVAETATEVVMAVATSVSGDDGNEASGEIKNVVLLIASATILADE